MKLCSVMLTAALLCLGAGAAEAKTCRTLGGSISTATATAECKTTLRRTKSKLQEFLHSYCLSAFNKVLRKDANVTYGDCGPGGKCKQISGTCWNP
jgi:hypothetical protein